MDRPVIEMHCISGSHPKGACNCYAVDPFLDVMAAAAELLRDAQGALRDGRPKDAARLARRASEVLS